MGFFCEVMRVGVDCQILCWVIHLLGWRRSIFVRIHTCRSWGRYHFVFVLYIQFGGYYQTIW
jgi:hypothetical protein